MFDWIDLNGRRSDTMEGLVVMEWTTLRMPKRTREGVSLPGRLTRIEQRAWQTEEAEIAVTLCLVDEHGQQAVQQRWRDQVMPWLLQGTRLTLSDDPQSYFSGAVTRADQVEDLDQWIRIVVTFTCNPPCPLRLLSRQPGWHPLPDQPIPPQLTDQNATAVQHFTAPGWIGEAYQGMEEAAYYLAVTGTWQKLILGTGFELHQAAESETTIYLDGENAQLWKLDGSTEVNLMPAATGGVAKLTHGQRLTIGGERLNIKVRPLIIQRS